MERQLIVCENDTRPTDPKAVQRKKLIMSNSSMQQRYNWEGTRVSFFIFPGSGSERPVVY